MGSPWNSDLGRRQKAQEVGFLNAGSARRRWKPLLIAFGFLLLGFALAQWSPLPGLGLLMIIGGALALPALALHVWLGD